MKAGRLRVRPMKREEAAQAVSWAADEGWNPGLDDAALFYDTDPAGFFGAEVDGEVVGAASAVAYGDNFGFGGLFIVAPEYRGRGFGVPLWRHGMAYLAGRNVGIDGVLERQENYKRLGFQMAYRNIRYEGTGGGGCPAEVQPLAGAAFGEVYAYDTAHFPAPRKRFLRMWLAQPHGVALAIRRDGRVRGYGVVRQCVRGCKIGPLFADGPAEAEALFQGLAAHAGEAPFYLDTPETNPEAIALANRHGMTPVFETARMYTQGPPDLPLHEIYGVTTFELG